MNFATGIEISKILLKNNPEEISWVLLTVFRNYLKLLHPIMPFITEELWSYVKDEDKILSLSDWPSDTEFRDEDSVKKASLIFDVIKTLRSLKQEMGIPFEKKISGFVYSQSYNELLSSNIDIISTLAKIEPLDILQDPLPPRRGIISSIQADFEVYVEIGDVIDIDEEIKRLQKKIEEIDLQIGKIESRLQNKDFLLKAKEEAKEKERNKKESLVKEREKLLHRLSLLSS